METMNARRPQVGGMMTGEGAESTEKKTQIKSVAVAMATFFVVVPTAIFAGSLAHSAASLAVIAVALIIALVGMTYSKVIAHG